MTLIELYNYYELILVLFVCFFTPHFCQWLLNFVNGCLLSTTVSCVACSSLSLLVSIDWKQLETSQFGIICPWSLIRIKSIFFWLAIACRVGKLSWILFLARATWTLTKRKWWYLQGFNDFLINLQRPKNVNLYLATKNNDRDKQI